MSPRTRHWINRWDVGAARLWRGRWWQVVTPAQLLVASFAMLVLAGTLGLRLLPGLYTGEPLGWLDALFTATSAVCVTGLVVVDTATYFTPAGQAYLLFLIQLGGLGIITLTSLVIVALGRRLSLRQEVLSGSDHDVAPLVDARTLTRDVVGFTFLIEAAGALALFLLWGPEMGWRRAWWPALFHSVSAFCNAGFSTFSDSLIGFQRSPATLLVVGTLILLGGLGFLTMEELRLNWRAWREGRRYRLSLHSRLVLVMTATLVLGGWVAFAAFEWGITLAGLPLVDRVTAAWFLSVTPRTAGFNVIDYAQGSDATAFLTILFMFIGGGPGSTAGGIKITTVALIALLAWTRFRGHEITSAMGRSVPEETIQRAVGLAVVAFTVVTGAIFLYTATEMFGVPHDRSGGRFVEHMFEAVSAFNTVGLTMGITPGLSPAGKWVTLLLMFVGRVGPLTFAAALALRPPTGDGEFRFAYEDVVVG